MHIVTPYANQTSTTDALSFPFFLCLVLEGNRYRHIVDLRAAHYRIRLL